MTLVLAHLLPLLFGAAAYLALVERPRRAADALQALGYGYVIGMITVASALAVFRPPPTQATAWILPALAVAGIALVGLAWHRWRHHRPARIGTAASPLAESAWSRWLLLVLAAWLLWRGWALVTEVAIRPVFPWDAWATWSVKAKTWFLADTWLPWVDYGTWLVEPDQRYLAAWFYPDGLPLLEVWFASAAGAWSEPAVHGLWPGVWLAGTSILVGQLRALGTSWWLAALAGFAWASLPMVNTHVALAGYADLPLTVLLAASGLALARHVEGHGRAHLALAVVLAGFMPLLKLEGALWLLVIAFGVVHALWSWRDRLLVVAIVVFALWLVIVGIRLPLPGTGWVEAGWGYLRIPAIGIDQALAWRPVGNEVVQAMLLAPNWHLLWWLSLPILLACLPAWSGRATLSWINLSFMVLVLGIFFFTDASAWAQDMTAMNRVLMHVTALWIAWLALLVSDRLGGSRDRGSDRPVVRPPDRSGSGRENAADPVPPGTA